MPKSERTTTRMKSKAPGDLVVDVYWQLKKQFQTTVTVPVSELEKYREDEDKWLDQHIHSHNLENDQTYAYVLEREIHREEVASGNQNNHHH